VSVTGRSGRDEEELPGHLEMDDQGEAAGKIQEDHFAAPAQPDNPPADKAVEEGGSPVPDDRPEGDPDRGDLEADEMPAEAANDRLHLGEFGHRPIILDLRRGLLYSFRS
jgi:hypothetical protein